MFCIIHIVMIASQQIKSTTSCPVNLENYEAVNVLKWNNSKWKNLCPYLLETDGNEKYYNGGGIIFENFYQGCKIYDIVYENEVYPHKSFINNPKYLWWRYKTVNQKGDVIYDKENDVINYELYLRWRDSLWKCEKPIRYPNKIYNRKNTQFSICIDKKGKTHRYDYIKSRKKIYAREYIRLIKQLPEYLELFNKLKNGKNIMICEVDVPANNKKGEYGRDCDKNNICHLTRKKLKILLNDTNEAYGHGLCLAHSLLKDLRKYKKINNLK